MKQLTRKQRYLLSHGIALDMNPLVGTVGHMVAHPIKTVTSPRKTFHDEYTRRAGNVYRGENDLPPVNENSMLSVKDIIAHHKAHEDVHRRGYEKFKDSDFPNTKPIADKHKRQWHHHAGIRTRYEAMDRAGKTHVPQQQYERDTNGRFASFSLSLVDEVVLAGLTTAIAMAEGQYGRNYPDKKPKSQDRFSQARASKHARQVLPRAHYVLPASTAAEFRDELQDMREHLYPDNKITMNMRRYQNPDPNDRQQWVMVDVETDDVSILHSIDQLAMRKKARKLDSRGNMEKTKIDPTARMPSPKARPDQLRLVYKLPEKLGKELAPEIRRMGARVDMKGDTFGTSYHVPAVIIMISAQNEQAVKFIRKFMQQEGSSYTREVSYAEWLRAVARDKSVQGMSLSGAHELRHLHNVGSI